jgi:hypothetical protein
MNEVYGFRMMPLNLKAKRALPSPNGTSNHPDCNHLFSAVAFNAVSKQWFGAIQIHPMDS